MKNKILAALCAICAFAMNFTVSLCPTASAADGEVYVYEGTYVNCVSFRSADHPGNIFFGFNDQISLSLKLKNKVSSLVRAKYTYDIYYESGTNTIYTSEESGWYSLTSGATSSLTIELPSAPKYGIYRLVLHLTNGTSNENLMTDDIETKFSVCIPLDKSNVVNSFGFNQAIINSGNGDAAYLMEKAGAKLHREDISWVGVEPPDPSDQTELTEEGYIYLTSYKQKIQDMQHDYGIETVGILNGRNSKYCDPFKKDGETLYCVPHTDEQIAAYARFCQYVATQLKGVVHYYEIWNEWNVETFNPSKESYQTYAKLLKAAYKAIKDVDPSITVIGCDTAGIPIGQDGLIYQTLEWLKSDYNQNRWTTDKDLDKWYCMDALSVHCYDFNPEGSTDTSGNDNSGFPEQEFQKKVSDLKSFLARPVYNLQNLPIWLTETGFSTYTGSGSGLNPDGSQSPGCTEEQQLSAMIMLNVVNRAYDLFGNVIQYCFNNRGVLPSYISKNWGVLYAYKRDEDNGAYPEVFNGAKQAYLGLAAMNYFIGGNTEYIKQEKNDTINRVYAFKFRNNNLNKDVTVAIAGGIGRSGNATVSIGNDYVDIYDKYGNHVESKTSTTGEYHLPVSTDPIYIVSGPEISVTKNGRPVTNSSGLKKGDTLSVSFKGKSVSVQDAAVIAAQYDENGKMIEADKFTSDTNFEGDITIAKATRRIKVYSWDMNGLEPITSVYDIQ